MNRIAVAKITCVRRAINQVQRRSLKLFRVTRRRSPLHVFFLVVFYGVVTLTDGLVTEAASAFYLLPTANDEHDRQSNEVPPLCNALQG